MFYKDLLGWEVTAGPSSMALLAGATGPFADLGARDGAAPGWLPYVQMDDVDAAIAKAMLEGFRPTPAVRVNRAFAVDRFSGPAVGLALLEGADMPGISRYPCVHLVRGTLVGELGRIAGARTELELAQRHARNAQERTQILAKLATLEQASEPFDDA